MKKKNDKTKEKRMYRSHETVLLMTPLKLLP